MKPRHATFAFVLAVAAGLAFAAAPQGDVLKTHQTVQGTATRIHDGDTFWLELPMVAHKIRLHGADAPEMATNKWPTQPGAVEAKNWLEKQINGKQVTCTVKGNSYGRYVCTVKLGDRDLSIELIENGLAMCDMRYANAAQKLAQAEAKAKKLGVWKDGKAIAPTDWRKGKR